MQAPISIPSAAPTATQGQAQGGGLGAVAGLGGLFATTDAGGTGDAGLDQSGFAEALMAVIGAAQPQLARAPAPPPAETDSVQIIDASVRPAATPFVPGLLTEAPAAGTDAAQADLSAAAQTGEDVAAVTPPLVAQDTEIAQAAHPLDARHAHAAGQGRMNALARAADDIDGPPGLTGLFNTKAASALTKATPPAFAGLEAKIAAQILPSGAAPAQSTIAAPLQVSLLEAADLAPIPSTQIAPAVQEQVIAAVAPQIAPQRPVLEQGKAEPKGKIHDSAGQAVADSGSAPDVSLAALAASAVGSADEGASDSMLQTALNQTTAPEGVDIESVDTAEPSVTPFAHLAARSAEAGPAAVDAPRVTSHTLNQLSAQISKAMEAGKSTRFDVQLEPMGLGTVDIRVEINRAGDITADLRFDNPMAAAELKHRSAELATALENAGFDPSKTQLSFSSGGQQNMAGQFGQDLWNQQQNQRQSSAFGAAFVDLANLAEVPAAYAGPQARAGGVDVRI